MTISVEDRKGTPLSFGQEQLWFLDQLSPGQTTYNILLVTRLRGPLDVDVLRRCLTLIVERHEALRVTIQTVDDVPCQVVSPPTEVELSVIDYTHLSPDDQEEAVQRSMHDLIHLPFDIQNGPLYRYRVLRLAPDHHVFLQSLHHIIVDGWSCGLTNAELAVAYRALKEGSEPQFAREGTNYTTFASAQRDYMQGATLAAGLDYWADKLANLPVLEMPTDRPRSVTLERGGNSVIREVSPAVLAKARTLAQDHNVSLYMVLAAALNVVLSRITGQEDIPIGVPMLSRVEPELEEVVGLFVNMMVLRSDLSGDPSFSDLLARTLDTAIDLYEHQDVPFHFIVDRVQPERDPSRNPLFQVSMQLLGRANSGGALDLPGIVSEPIPVRSGGSRFDMAIDYFEAEDSMLVTVEYSADLFDSWRIEGLLNQIENVVIDAAADPSRRLSELTLLSDAEKAD